MLMYRALLIFIFCELNIGASFSAEPLQWEQRVIEKNAERHEIVAVSFRFKNSSDRQITIQSVTPNCDCLTAQLKKSTFAPGEQGQIDVVFNVADSTGPEFKSITVTTSENPNAPTELLLKVQIPRLIEVTPQLLTWRVGEEPTEKSADISLVAEPVITVTGVKSKNAEVAIHLQTIVPNRHYRLFVKPASTARPCRASFTLTTTLAGGDSSQTHVIYAQVR